MAQQSTQPHLAPPPGSRAEEPRNLIQKAAAVMACIEHVPKNGRNAFHGYDYATEADIVAAVRKEMARHGLMLIPAVEKVEWTKVAKKNGGEERLCTLTVKFTLTDGTEDRSVVVLGEGQDQGDKASYKALTGALKYALLKLFLIPTGDDPELDDEKPARGKQDPKPKQETKPEPPKGGPILEARVHAVSAGMMKLGLKTPDARKAKAASVLGHAFRQDSPDDVNALEVWLKAETNIETTAQVLGATRDGINPAA